MMCRACDDSGIVTEIEPVGDGTITHTYLCDCGCLPDTGPDYDSRWEEAWVSIIGKDGA